MVGNDRLKVVNSMVGTHRVWIVWCILCKEHTECVRGSVYVGNANSVWWMRCLESTVWWIVCKESKHCVVLCMLRKDTLWVAWWITCQERSVFYVWKWRSFSAGLQSRVAQMKPERTGFVVRTTARTS